MSDYTGLGALAWEVFTGDEPGPDQHYFQHIIEEHHGLALDVGCGTGRLLIPYLEAGLEVDGVDPSADMLAICRDKATALGLVPRLYQQAMQQLDLARVYSTIIVPCGTIQLVVDRAEAFEALRRLYAHLVPGGVLVLTVYNRWREMEVERLGKWHLLARQALPDGTLLYKHVRVERCNLLEQTLAQSVRYRRTTRERRIIEEQRCDAPERWYFKHELVLMLERVGFGDIRVTGNYSDAAAADHHSVLAFAATR